LKKNWKLKTLFTESIHGNSIDYISFIENVKDKVKLSDTFLHLLYLRGITNHEEILKFFKPCTERLYDPFLMKDMDIACNRILKAIESKEKIMITSDYDVDGTCGAAIFYLFMKKFGIECEVYIPERESEGHGISEQSIYLAKREGINLIVAIDFGITAYDKIELANSLGVEFIICDHHQLPEKIPRALAVLDPLRPDCNYPSKDLCGTGVAFKLIQAVCQKLNEPDYPLELLDYVAIATATDFADLTDENRIMVDIGFDLLNKKKRPSLKKLVDSIDLQKNEITSTGVIFSIASKLNAVCRLGDAKESFDFLICEDDKELEKRLSDLDETNSDKREIGYEITKQAIEMVENTNPQEMLNSIIIHNPDWHPGVVSIVAARLVEKYNLPTVVLATSNGVIKGSARSINGFNIYEALKYCGEYLIQYGGHCHAAGLELLPENLEIFKKKFYEFASQEYKNVDTLTDFEIEAEVKFCEINREFLFILNYFPPYGPGNPQPLFLTKNVLIEEEPKLLKNNSHLIRLKEIDSNTSVNAFIPSSQGLDKELVLGRQCDVCYSINQKSKNFNSLTINVRDIEIKN